MRGRVARGVTRWLRQASDPHTHYPCLPLFSGLCWGARCKQQKRSDTRMVLLNTATMDLLLFTWIMLISMWLAMRCALHMLCCWKQTCSMNWVTSWHAMSHKWVCCLLSALRTDGNHICVQLQLQLLVSQWFSLSYTLPKSQVLRSCIRICCACSGNNTAGKQWAIQQSAVRCAGSTAAGKDNIVVFHGCHTGNQSCLCSPAFC